MPADTKRKYIPKIIEKIKAFPWYIDEYINHKIKDHSPLTLLNYLSDYEIFFDWLVVEGYYSGKRTEVPLEVLEKLRVVDIDNYVFFIKNIKNTERISSTKTIDRRISSLKSLFHYLSQIAEDEELYPYIKRNVMAKYEMKSKKLTANAKAKLIEGKILRGQNEFDEFRRFVYEGYPLLFYENKRIKIAHSLNKERDTAIISLFLGTGMRLSELVGLNIDDVSFKDNELKILRKSNKDDVIFFSDNAKADLLRYIEIREIKYLTEDKERALFLSYPNGYAKGNPTRMKERSIQDMVKKYAEAFEKKFLSVHKLRHSFATEFIKKNKDPDSLQVLKDQLGHESIDTTLIYTHLTGDQQKKSVIKADEYDDDGIGNENIDEVDNE